MTPTAVLAVASAFLAGSFPTAYVVGRFHGIDIRTVGSGNVGATNVFRTLGKTAGIFTLVTDALNGWGPVMAIMAFFPDPWTPVLGALAAVLGHTFTPFLGFKGGKGVATSAGVFLALLPGAALCALAAFLAGFLSTKKVSVGSLAAAVALPLCACLMKGLTPASGLSILVAVLVIVKHAPNIKRLIKGEESSFKKP
jgi:glycerol-3-phosphate acyltransferase PlsY